MLVHEVSAAQEVPAPDAAYLRSLKDVDNPLLNALLSGYRDRGWHTPELARALGMKEPAVSKRVERARRASAAARAPLPDDASERERAAHLLLRQEQAALRARVAAVDIPAPPPAPPRATLTGRRLSEERIAELRRMQQVAARVTGAMPADHPSRRTSEAFAEELHRLINEEGFSAYYLAAAIGVSNRAITSRLERHHFRKPCPSVAGTPSGVYYDRKIGDGGTRAPRLSADDREWLRTLWEAVRDNPEDATQVGLLRGAVGEHLDAGFTLANLARAMKARYGDLQALLGFPPAPVDPSADRARSAELKALARAEREASRKRAAELKALALAEREAYREDKRREAARRAAEPEAKAPQKKRSTRRVGQIVVTREGGRTTSRSSLDRIEKNQGYWS